MSSRLRRLPRPFRLAALLAGVAATAAPASSALAGSAEAAADTTVTIGSIGKAGDAGTVDTLSIRSERPAGDEDRVAVLRFDLPAAGDDAKPADDAEPADFAGATLVLHAATTPESAKAGSFEVYGVAPGASEATLDEATYSANGYGGAVDKSGNRLREQRAYDADPDADGVQPLAVAKLAEGAATVTFDGPALQKYLASVGGGGSAAFVVVGVRPRASGAMPAALLHSREATDPAERPTLSWK